MIDDVTRKCLALIPDMSISCQRVARELTALIECSGKLGMIVGQKGTKLTLNEIATCCAQRNIEWDYSSPES